MRFEDIKMKAEETMTKTDGYAYIADREGHMVRLFQIVDGDFRELPLEQMVDKISQYIRERINPTDVIKDLLLTQVPASHIVEAAERVERKAVLKRKHCCAVTLRGKKGKAFWLWLIPPGDRTIMEAFWGR